MAEMQDTAKVNELGAFFFQKACAYRKRIDADEVDPVKFLKFPLHQFGFVWEEENLSGIGPFQKIRIYKVNVRMEENGLAVLDRCEKIVLDLQY
jgi:hypothetical protein